MTQRQLLNLVGHWQDFLGLNHWTIGVDFSEPADEGDFANIRWAGAYDSATMLFETDWQTWDQLRANEIIVHELLHLVARDLRMAWISVKNQVPAAVWDALDDRYDHEFEGVIDRLACKFVELANS